MTLEFFTMHAEQVIFEQLTARIRSVVRISMLFGSLTMPLGIGEGLALHRLETYTHKRGYG